MAKKKLRVYVVNKDHGFLPAYIVGYKRDNFTLKKVMEIFESNNDYYYKFYELMNFPYGTRLPDIASGRLSSHHSLSKHINKLFSMHGSLSKISHIELVGLLTHTTELAKRYNHFLRLGNKVEIRYYNVNAKHIPSIDIKI